MDLVVYQPVGTLSSRHDFLSSWDCLLASSPDALCELSWHLTQCSTTSLKAACVQRLKKEIQGPVHLSVWRGIQDLEPPVEYVEGSKDLAGLILGRTFMEKMIKFTPVSVSAPHPPEEMVVGTKDRCRQRKTEWFARCPETLFWVCTNVRKVSEKSGLLGLAWNGIHLQRQPCLET